MSFRNPPNQQRGPWSQGNMQTIHDRSQSGTVARQTRGGLAATTSNNKDLNMWQHFFGESQVPFSRPVSENNHKEMSIRPDAFSGSNPMISRFLIHLITKQDMWPFQELSPMTAFEDGMTISLDAIIFDRHLLNRTPELGISRLITSTKSSDKFSMVRWGIAMMMEDGFYETAEGRKTFAANLLQIKTATQETMCHSIMIAFFYPNMSRFPDRLRLDSLRNEGDLHALLNEACANFGLFAKSNTGLEQAIDMAKDRLVTNRGSGGEGNYGVISKGSLKVVGMRKERNYAMFSGVNGESTSREQRAKSGITIRETSKFCTGEGNETRDFSVQEREIGGFILMDDRSVREIPRDEFRTSMLDIQTYSNQSDDYDTHAYASRIFDSGLFVQDNSTGRWNLTSFLGKRYFRGSRTWGDFLRQVELFDETVKAVSKLSVDARAMFVSKFAGNSSLNNWADKRTSRGQQPTTLAHELQMKDIVTNHMNQRPGDALVDPALWKAFLAQMGADMATHATITRQNPGGAAAAQNNMGLLPQGQQQQQSSNDKRDLPYWTGKETILKKWETANSDDMGNMFGRCIYGYSPNFDKLLFAGANKKDTLNARKAFDNLVFPQAIDNQSPVKSAMAAYAETISNFVSSLNKLVPVVDNTDLQDFICTPLGAELDSNFTGTWRYAADGAPNDNSGSIQIERTLVPIANAKVAGLAGGPVTIDPKASADVHLLTAVDAKKGYFNTTQRLSDVVIAQLANGKLPKTLDKDLAVAFVWMSALSMAFSDLICLAVPDSKTIIFNNLSSVMTALRSSNNILAAGPKAVVAAFAKHYPTGRTRLASPFRVFEHTFSRFIVFMNKSAVTKDIWKDAAIMGVANNDMFSQFRPTINTNNLNMGNGGSAVLTNNVNVAGDVTINDIHLYIRNIHAAVVTQIGDMKAGTAGRVSGTGGSSRNNRAIHAFTRTEAIDRANMIQRLAKSPPYSYSVPGSSTVITTEVEEALQQFEPGFLDSKREFFQTIAPAVFASEQFRMELVYRRRVVGAEVHDLMRETGDPAHNADVLDRATAADRAMVDIMSHADFVAIMVMLNSILQNNLLRPVQGETPADAEVRLARNEEVQRKIRALLDELYLCSMIDITGQLKRFFGVDWTALVSRSPRSVVASPYFGQAVKSLDRTAALLLDVETLLSDAFYELLPKKVDQTMFATFARQTDGSKRQADMARSYASYKAASTGKSAASAKSMTDIHKAVDAEWTHDKFADLLDVMEIDGEFIKFAIANHLPMIIPLLLVAPHMTYNMGTFGLCLAYGKCMRTYYGAADMQFDRNVTRKMMYGNFTTYMKACVTNPEAIAHVQDVSFHGYVRGNCPGVWDPNNQLDLEDYRNQVIGKTWFVVPYYANENPQDIHGDITGKWSPELMGSSPEKLPWVQTLPDYAEFWGWHHDKNILTRPFLSAERSWTSNTVVHRYMSLHYNHGSKKHDLVRVNKNPLGPQLYPGCGQAHEGKVPLQPVGYANSSVRYLTYDNM